MNNTTLVPLFASNLIQPHNKNESTSALPIIEKFEHDIIEALDPDYIVRIKQKPHFLWASD